MADAVKRGQHRSWYVDELVSNHFRTAFSFCRSSSFAVRPFVWPFKYLINHFFLSFVFLQEWIKSRDHPEDEGDEAAPGDGTGSTAPTAGTENGSATRKAAPKQQWLPAPTDSAMAHTTCPICQEKFETVWHDEAQEWVWMDAVKIKGRIYHASCHAEASKDGVSTPRLTPDPPALLGKRKAEVSSTFFPHFSFFF
jgi:hypothetical protein